MVGKKKITGIILAGGKSSRMGTDKGLLKFQGETLVARMLDVLNSVTDSIMIISANPEYEKFGVPVYADIHPDRGPLGGIHTGLFHSKTELNLVIGCDMPFIEKNFLEYLVSKFEENRLLVPVHGDKTEPLCAIYPRSALPKIESLLLEGELKMQKVVRTLGAKWLTLPKGIFDPSQLFRNMNSREDMESLN